MSTDTSLFTKPILGDLLFKINDAVNERICLFSKFYGINFIFLNLLSMLMYMHWLLAVDHVEGDYSGQVII
jgi:hypothetical protein